MKMRSKACFAATSRQLQKYISCMAAEMEKRIASTSSSGTLLELGAVPEVVVKAPVLFLGKHLMDSV